jgi:16S rRNA (guanine966-N2)-methyltransferase
VDRTSAEAVLACLTVVLAAITTPPCAGTPPELRGGARCRGRAACVHTNEVARVIAGEAGGRRLTVPSGRQTRPTSDRAREGLFATVTSIVGPLAGSRVLDLYAGSGAVGLEALSRGAGHVLLVESGARAARVIRENIAAIGLPGAIVIADRVERVLARGPAPVSAKDPDPAPLPDPADARDHADVPDPADARDHADAEDPAGAPKPGPAPGSGAGRYDIVFADPPYAAPDEEVTRVLSLLAGAGWLAPSALVVVERATRSGPVRWPGGPEGFVPDRARRYGEATFWYGLGPGAQPS